MKTIIEAIKATFPKEKVERLTGENRFADIAGWDSMNSVSFQIELESLLGREPLDFVITGDMTLKDLAHRLKESAGT